MRATPASAMLAGAASVLGMWLFDAALQRAAPAGGARLLALLMGAALFVVLPALLFVVGRDAIVRWRAGDAGADPRTTRAALRRGLAWFVGGGAALLVLSSLGDLHAAQATIA